jgi:4-amino-4-deoxy-L-arabinose transferase-like glycosyltransferase
MKLSPSWQKGLIFLALIWLGGVLVDRLWFNLDHSIPAWDQADYLNGALNYHRALENPQWFNLNWWRELWLLSPKIPPLTYLLTVPFLHLGGLSEDSATVVMLLFSAILLASVYGLGVVLFDVQVGLWAAALCQLLPGLYVYRLQFLLDFPLAALVTCSFFTLTLWYFSSPKTPLGIQWSRAIAWGIVLGLAFLLKQTALFFLLFPLLWALFQTLKQRQWERLGQYLGASLVCLGIFYPWYRTNWLLILTSGKRATIDSALIEGDPPLNDIAAWTYYFKVLPFFLSWVFLIASLVGVILYWFYRRKKASLPKTGVGIWLGIFVLGGYFLSSLNVNKDARYILPLLPTLSLLLAAGLLSWPGRYRRWWRWGIFGTGILLMFFNLFPLGSWPHALSPKMQHYPYTGKPWPHAEVIATILAASPHLQTTLGVLPSTEEINQHSLSFFGKSFPSLVVGRQVGVREKELEADRRSLDWFLLKTGDQGSVGEIQAKMSAGVSQDEEFSLQKSWPLPDESELLLYKRQQPQIVVKPFPLKRPRVTLEKITLPPTAPPNIPLPVTYRWTGEFNDLKSGLVLLTWRQVDGEGQWLHDHAIAMGRMTGEQLTPTERGYTYSVDEYTAMLPSAPPGTYTLAATYLNRDTGETYPIPIPRLTLTLDPATPALPAPELDLVTQMRALSPALEEGIPALEPIFTLAARINQYDATQDYVKQLEESLSARLSQEKRLDWAYGVALARILGQDVNGAIAALEQIITLEPNNPNHYGYLAFVYLYDWQAQAAQKTVQLGQQIEPDHPELKLLEGIAAVMQGNLLKAWPILRQAQLP